LVLTQLGAWRSCDDAAGDGVVDAAEWVVLISPVGNRENFCLENILNDCVTAGHVAIQRAVARCHLAFVARGQDNAAKLI